MTKSFENWLEGEAKKEGRHVHELIRLEIYWAIRAFCDEVTRRAAKKDDPDAVWMAFETLKRELLG